MSPRRIHGASLLELVLVVSLIGILAAATYPTLVDTVPAAEERSAIASAAAINSAKRSYALRSSNAATNWANASTNEARFLLIRDRIAMADGVSLVQYTPSGYSYNLGATLNTRVVITGPNGLVSY